MNKLVIGVIGEIGSGKASFADIFQELATDKKVMAFASQIILAKTLDLWFIPKARENYATLASLFEHKFGQGTKARALRNIIDQEESEIVIVDGLRWEGEFEMLDSFPNHILLYITAPPEIRYERIKKRAEKKGEKDLTFEKFMEQANLESERLIPTMGKKADYTIDNGGSMEEFRKHIQEFLDLHC